ncbi:MAG: hypothetical protein H7Y43_02300 [Akkermansiaceae bacterium]|nr:hypothetical protein [Verrucomicrobiales bacterium]
MKILKTAIALLLTAGAVQCYAQQTNLVQNLSIQLYGIKEGRTTTNFNYATTGVEIVRVDTRQVIQALASALALPVSSAGRLVLITPLSGGDVSVQIRDGENTPIDVSSFFELQPLSGSVQSLQRNLRTGRGIQTDYYIQRVALKDTGDYSLSLHFDVSGVSVGSSTPGAPNRPGANISADVSGAGDRNGNLLILQGSVGVHGHTTEVVDGGLGQT